MLYSSADAYLNAPQKSVALFGMSGLGKSYLSNLLRETGAWFHYSVDYRIGTRYMDEPIADNFKREAMKSPLLRELLMSDSVYVASNITFDNLAPLSTYLGKPGSERQGGLPIDEYKRRQCEHREAEISAVNDVSHFIKRSHELYGYPNFVADCSGSLCEILDDDISKSEVMKSLATVTLPVWIEGPKTHNEFLIDRFKKAPKPMYYRPQFLDQKWDEYLSEKSVAPEDVDPDDFIVWGYRELLNDRLPRYREIADQWGISVHYDEVSQVNSPDEFNQLIASKL